MRKQILGYIPGNLIPAVVSVATIMAFTRLLSPAEFGRYSYGFAAIMIAQVSVFTAVGLAVVRFYPDAIRAGTVKNFLKTAYGGFMLVSAAGLALAVALSFVAPTLRALLWVLVPSLLLRAVIQIDQSINRMDSRMWRYNLLECSQAAVGFLAGLGLVLTMGATAQNVLLGLVIGSVVTCAVDMRQIVAPFVGKARVDWKLMGQMSRYAGPLALSYAVFCTLQYGDRFIVAALAGAHGLGIYAAAFSLVERPTTLISVAITTATFPMAVKAMEYEGDAAGRHQMGRNGAVLLALIMPACLGVALTSRHIADVMVGSEFREGVALLMPVIAATALMRNISAHFVDHAFHLSRRSDLMLAAYGPAAVANLALDFVLIPRYGVMGAAYAGLACQAGLLVWGSYLAHRTGTLWLPWGQVARIGGALGAMTAALAALDPADGWVGLAILVGAGLVAYGGAAYVLDVSGVRDMVTDYGRRLGRGRVSPPVIVDQRAG